MLLCDFSTSYRRAVKVTQVSVTELKENNNISKNLALQLEHEIAEYV